METGCGEASIIGNVQGIFGGVGSDSLTVNDANANVGTFVSGGGGNDTIVGSIGPDQLLGGVGSNRVSAGSVDASLVLNQAGEADIYSGVPGMLFQPVTSSSDICLDPADFANAVL